MKKAIISVAKIYLVSILLGVFQKVIFLVTYSSRTVEIGVDGVMGVIFNGLRLDISTAGYITALPLLAIILGTWGGWLISNRAWRRIIGWYLALVTLLVAIIAAVDLNLYGYWGYRIDSTLIPYLATPTDAVASVTMGDILTGGGALVLILVVAFWAYRWAVRDFAIWRISWRYRFYDTAGLLLLAGLLFLGIRGGVDMSVANISKVYFSTNQFANHAAVNPTFSLISSLGEAKQYDQMYNYFETSELRRNFDKIRPPKSDSLRGAHFDLRPNILIVIGESYSRHIFDLEVDGKTVMPNLRQIAHEGLYFSNTYATGHRTDKGVASVLSGFPSQPKISIMKIPAKSRNLPSLAHSLVDEGYTSHFYYGGDLNFMDMSSYLYATGWQNLTWKRDITNTAEASCKWGYSDGVMVDIVADSLDVLARRPEPFIATWLTLSSHEPFDVPRDYGFTDPMINSMAYTDGEIGRLVARLKESGVWDNLLLIVVGDHTYNSANVPNHNYHKLYNIDYHSPLCHLIPHIWSGGALNRHGVEDSFVSQVDIPVTLLGELGISNRDFKFGRDIFDPNSTDAQLGYYTYNDGSVVVDSLGASIFDNTSLRTFIASPHSGQVEASSSSVDSHDVKHRRENSKTILQMTHLEIEML